MKYKYCVLSVLVLVCLGLSLLHRRRPPPEVSRPLSNLSSSSAGAIVEPVASTATDNAPSELKAALNAAAAFTSGHINFFGRVLDFSNQPVSGVNIHYTWMNPSGLPQATTETDPDGRFAITNRRGILTTVNISKAGYQVPPSSMINPEDPNLPATSASSPHIFRIRRKAGERLIPIIRSMELKTNNVFTPQPVEIHPSPRYPTIFQVATWAEPHDRSEKFDWGFRLRLEDGKVLKTEEEFPVEAPLKGSYVEEFIFTAQKDDPSWVREFKATFYFVLGSEKPIYGRFDFNLPGGGLAGGLIGIYNPSGSRILD
jgi:hypothetical protein